jgi:diacylglycerol kinase (ATP)
MSLMGDRIKAFGFAFKGIAKAAKNEIAFKLHLLAAAIVILFGIIFSVSPYEWMYLSFCMAIVITAELFNTAIEKLCDLYSKEKDERIAYIKDISAGAVLISVTGAVIGGAVIFWPHVLRLFLRGC